MGPGPPELWQAGRGGHHCQHSPQDLWQIKRATLFSDSRESPSKLKHRDSGAASPLTLPQQFSSPCPFRYQGAFNTSTHVPTRPRRYNIVPQCAPGFHSHCKECSTHKKYAFSTFSMLFDSPWESGQCKSKTMKKEKEDQQAGARAKQGMVFAPRWVAPNRVGGSDAGGASLEAHPANHAHR